eukprot:8274707-Pyramimonas_sp.AAC.2
MSSRSSACPFAVAFTSLVVCASAFRVCEAFPSAPHACFFPPFPLLPESVVINAQCNEHIPRSIRSCKTCFVFPPDLVASTPSPPPRQVADTLELGRATLAKIKQNLAWALAYNVIGEHSSHHLNLTEIARRFRERLRRFCLRRSTFP